MVASILERAGRRIGPAGTADAARGRRLLDWRHLAIAALVAVQLPLVAYAILVVLKGSGGLDWAIFIDAPRRFFEGGLYDETATYAYRWHPILAPLFGPIAVMGLRAWQLLHVAAALAMPTWTMRLLVLLSWPFWWDVEAGNVIVFLLLAAAWAIGGNRLATFAFLAATVLIPRPLMLPVAAWLLWQRPEWRLPFIALAVASLTAAFATGWGGEWIGRLIASSDEMGSVWNLGPSRIIGAWWLLAGVPLAAWLTWKGRVGLASLAVTPYLLPYYLLFGLLETRREGSTSKP